MFDPTWNFKVIAKYLSALHIRTNPRSPTVVKLIAGTSLLFFVCGYVDEDKDAAKGDSGPIIHTASSDSNIGMVVMQP